VLLSRGRLPCVTIFAIPIIVGRNSRDTGGNGPRWSGQPGRRPECGENEPAEADV